MSHATHTPPPRPKAQFTLMATFWLGSDMPDAAAIDQQRAIGAAGIMNATLHRWTRTMASMTFLAPCADDGLHPDAYQAAERYLAGNLRRQFGADNLRNVEFTVFEPQQSYEKTAQP